MSKQFPAVVDNSMRKSLVRCQKMAEWQYEYGYVPTDSDPSHKIAGGAFAAGLEAARLAFYVRQERQEKALQAGIEALMDKYGSYVPPAGSNKTAARMAGALAYYCQQRPFAEDEFQPLQLNDDTWGIECSFDFPIWVLHPITEDMLIYCGRFDMLATDRNGDVWVVDEKTTGKFGAAWANQWTLDSQMTSYVYGARSLLEKHGIDKQVRGAVINGIAIMKYDYEHLRLNVPREPWELQRWLVQTEKDFKNWAKAYKEDSYNQVLDHACALYNSPCDYAKLCKSRNPERVIEGNYQVIRWNPLNRTESKE